MAQTREVRRRRVCNSLLLPRCPVGAEATREDHLVDEHHRRSEEDLKREQAYTESLGSTGIVHIQLEDLASYSAPVVMLDEDWACSYPGRTRCQVVSNDYQGKTSTRAERRGEIGKTTAINRNLRVIGQIMLHIRTLNVYYSRLLWGESGTRTREERQVTMHGSRSASVSKKSIMELEETDK